ncbi:MAG: DUF5677 domain-containing protein [Christensenellaceae bacterium]
MNNTSKIEQSIAFAHKIIAHIEADILHEGQPIIILEEYDWLREILSLLAKQTNLFESAILLLESNMEDEAYILVRSQFNNMLWISYLSGDENHTRVKEYFYEPMITQYLQFGHILSYLKTLSPNTPHYEKFKSLDTKKIKEIRKSIKTILQSEHYNIDDLKSKSIFSLTQKDPGLLGMYLSFYNDASKFEHADISTVKKYRSSAAPDVDTNTAFILDLSKSDISKWKTVFSQAIHILFTAINELYDRLKKRDSHLFDFEQFEEAGFSSAILNLKILSDLVDSIQIVEEGQ